MPDSEPDYSSRPASNMHGPERQSDAHPFAHSTAKLELIPASTSADGIDVEEEARLYDDLCRTYEDATDNVRISSYPTIYLNSIDAYSNHFNL
jgi:hypothetical protein